MQLKNTTGLKGTVTVPGDKSISHRLIMLGSIAEGETRIKNFPDSADCLSTINCFRKMGVEIIREGDEAVIRGRGLRGLAEPQVPLDAGNSATAARLLCGILSGQKFVSRITGDASLKRRPMDRIIKPMSAMGAKISDAQCSGRLPLLITGGALKGVDYRSDVASAQVKSAVLLAGLYAEGATSFTEPCLSRDHTEILLRRFGARVDSFRGKNSPQATARVFPCEKLYGRDIFVPCDISSAAYFIAAGLIVPDSELLIKNVGVNPTRAGIIEAAKKMGGDISLLDRHMENNEPVCDILVRTSTLRGVTIEGETVPTLIDELPVLAVMAAFAAGTTTVRDAAELKVKESDRIGSITQNLRAMGCEAESTADGFKIEGGRPLKGAVIDTHRDHRIAMAFSVAALAAQGTSTIPDSECAGASYPGFFSEIEKISRQSRHGPF